MSEYLINGAKSLNGTVRVSGAKNAVLPILCASLLCDEGSVTLTNCPDISDVTYTLDILSLFNCTVSFTDGQISVNATNAKFAFIPPKLTLKLRSACLFLGAAIGRFGKAEQYLPGGCELGSRPIDLHLSSFTAMGVDCSCEKDVIKCQNRPHGTDIFLRFASVGATENIIISAAKGRGTTTITGAAREPEIVDLCNFINAMGGKISGAGSSIIIIEGVEKLRAINYNIIGDRIEAATFLSLALATDGEITVTGVNPNHLSSVVDVMVNSGAFICKRENSITAKRGGHFVLSPGTIRTATFPGFPTDAQSVIIAMLLKCLGTATVCERIFDDRLRVCNEFLKLGANITVNKNTAKINGVQSLCGAELYACDLRSGAALVVAALSANGASVVKNVSHILRGYDSFDTKLRSLGADITLIKDL